MSLATELRTTLAQPIGDVIADLGLPLALRRKRTVNEANGTTSVEWVTVEGVPATVFGAFATLARRAAERAYGRDTQAEASVVMMDTVPVVVGDRLIILSGVFASTAWDVIEQEPTDAGGVVIYGLKGVPAGVDYGL